jgi:hypothetical protein
MALGARPLGVVGLVRSGLRPRVDVAALGGGLMTTRLETEARPLE